MKISGYLRGRHQVECAIHDPTRAPCDCGAERSIPLVGLAEAQAALDKKAEDYAVLAAERDQLRTDLVGKQAELDALMLEYCPGEMTPEQRARWAAAQQPASKAEPKEQS